MTASETNDVSVRCGLQARIALWSAAVAGVFICAVLALMAWDYGRRLVKDPLDSDDYRDLKDVLGIVSSGQVIELAPGGQSVEPDLPATPVDHFFVQWALSGIESGQGVKMELAGTGVVTFARTATGKLFVVPSTERLLTQVREMDLQLRRAYFNQRGFAAGGAWLLLGGVAVLLVSLHAAATLRRKLPMPEVQPVLADHETPRNAIARWAVGGMCVVLIGTATGLIWGIGSALYQSETPPSREEIAANWPYFRGPGGLGISAYDNVPTTWDAAKGEGILWKTPVPLEGNSSPIVWNDRIFLTGATQTARQVYCFDAASGRLLWQKDMPATPASQGKQPEPKEDAGYASSTPATDGRRVYAWFAMGDLAAFDFNGKLVWSRSFGVPKNSYGHATSLTMWRNLLIVQFDQAQARDGKSKIMALDSRTGTTVWETPREVPNSWCTPIVIEVGGQEQIIACGDPWVVAYNPADGKEIWRADCLRGEVACSPVFADGLVYAVHEMPQLSAIRPDGHGDVTSTHIAWIGVDHLPDTCSPLATSQYVLLLKLGGVLTCYDAKTGKNLWIQDFDATFRASPSLAGKYVYLPSSTEDGKVFVVEPGPTGCKTVAVATLGEPCSASPAFQDGRIYLRGKQHLFCIGKQQ